MIVVLGSKLMYYVTCCFGRFISDCFHIEFKFDYVIIG